MARRHLLNFGTYVYDWWLPRPVHELLCNALEEVYQFIETSGQEGCGSLIIEMPPQHGKTTIVSQLFPAWLLGKRPDSKVILTAYGADLSTESSRQVLQIITGEKFVALFGEQSVVEEPVQIAADSQAKAAWNLAEPHRGGLIATSVGGGTTGKRGHLIVVDDPFKLREQAENPAERKKVLKWMTSSVLSRVRRGTAIVIIHTRWHREDLIGEMLKSMITDPKARQWKVISLPALPLEAKEYAINLDEQWKAMLQGLYKPFSDPLGREPGSKTPLWPEEFPASLLDQIRSTLESTGESGDWWSLYEQQPRPSEGVFFNADDFPIVERAPEGLDWVRYVDVAISEKNSADWNASVAEALGEDGTLYLRDMIREKGWDRFEGRLKATMVSPDELGTRWGIETVAFQALVLKDLLKDKDLAAVSMLPITPDEDKVRRARPLQTRAKNGKVRLVRGPWNQVFLMEMLDFPTGQHDDQVDTASGGLEMLAGGAGWIEWAKKKLEEMKARKAAQEAVGQDLPVEEMVANGA